VDGEHGKSDAAGLDHGGPQLFFLGKREAMGCHRNKQFTGVAAAEQSGPNPNLIRVEERAAKFDQSQSESLLNVSFYRRARKHYCFSEFLASLTTRKGKVVHGQRLV
jgi:hypothetical protein